jgi:hypothetical protein
MLKITIHDSAQELRFRLEGRLAGAWVTEMWQCWQTALSTTQGRRTVLDLGEVDFIDTEGENLLRRMSGEGVKLQAATPLIQAVVEEVSGAACCGRVERSPRRPDALVSSTSGRHARTV